MAGAGYGFLKKSATVFKVLAWISLVLQVVVGLILLIGGGQSVPIGGVDVPARVVGILNCVAGAIYFFLWLFLSHIVRLLLDIHCGLNKGSCSS